MDGMNINILTVIFGQKVFNFLLKYVRWPPRRGEETFARLLAAPSWGKSEMEQRKEARKSFLSRFHFLVKHVSLAESTREKESDERIYSSPCPRRRRRKNARAKGQMAINEKA
jgi:hypothetical protein